MSTSLLTSAFAKSAPTDFPIHELLKERWSPRAFSADGLTADELNTLFEAARWAPSAFNEQPWFFLVATRRQPAQFAKLLGCLNANNQQWAQKAAGLAITVVRQDLAGKPQPNRTAHYDLGQAVASFTFQATALGVAVHQMAGLDLEKARSEYEIPAGFEPVTAMAFGRPGDSAALPEPLRIKDAAPRKRKQQQEFVFAGSWNSLFDPMQRKST